MIRNGFNKLLWLLQWMQYAPRTMNRARLSNVRSARNTIEICREIGLEPHALFDVGANRSQWAYWIVKEWPNIILESFEPNVSEKPMGRVHRVALSDRSGIGSLIGNNHSAYIVEGCGDILVERFDSYWKTEIPSHSILKIDAEAHSKSALIGFGHLIHSFNLVIVESCWSNCRDNMLKGQAVDIFRFMLSSGFDCITSVDEGVFSGRCDFSDMAFWKSSL